jgi:hypothetical protein
MAEKKKHGGKREGSGRKPHEPTEHQRGQAKSLAGFGVTVKEIAALMGIDQETLTKYYQDDMDAGRATANARVSSRLFDRATKEGDTTAMIWWTKARMKWSEKTEHEHTGAGGGPIQIITGIDRTPDGSEG